LPYQQLLADCNPDAPTHWLKQRADRGQTVLLESRHEDNPTLWDRAQQTWTTVGAAYMAILDALTGVRKERLRYGRWAAAEGLVYDGWDRAVHLIDPFPIPADWPRYWVVDFGFTNPFVLQWWAQDPDGRLYLYRELYHTHRLVEDHARQALALIGVDRRGDRFHWAQATEPRPRAVISDHDAEDRATFERHVGLTTTAAYKAVSAGIQAVAARLRPAGDGKPRLLVFRNAVVERDPALEVARKPIGLAEEMDGYVWDTSANRKKGEEPLKRDDHAEDCVRYLVAYVDQIDKEPARPFRPAVGPPRPLATPFGRAGRP
jgi:phage terminase large subunit